MSDHERLTELFLAAARLDGEEREAFLEEACGDDAELRAELEALLEQDRRPPALEAVAAAARGPWEDGPAQQAVGPYRIVGTIGVGGMGIVYEAEQQHPARLVALKVLRPGVLDTSLVKRFEVEAQVLGWLDHPGIARIYEAGTADTGGGRLPYFAMELVRGDPLVEHANERGLGVRARLELVAKVADAVHHAHQKGVIHRDLKPANVLVDAAGRPRVLDFGIARVTDADLRRMTIETRAGEIVGTLPYMSPEQVSGEPSAIDTRSDVYALGVLAYELLTGDLPLDVHDVPLHEAARVVVEQEPARLGARDPRLRGDVETIVAKALEKDKERRYASAEELASDLRRYLADEPIAARPPSASYQLRKFVRRHRVLVAGSAATLLAIVAGLVVSVVLYFDARDSEERATKAEGAAREALADERAARAAATRALSEEQRAREEAEDARAAAEESAASLLEVQEFYDDLYTAATPAERGADTRVVDVLRRGTEELDGAFPDRPLSRARLAERTGSTYTNIGLHREGLELLERAAALFDEHTEPDLHRARLEHKLAMARFSVLDFPGALAGYERTLELLRELGQEHTVEGTDALLGRAQTLMNLSRMDEARAAARAGLAAARALDLETRVTTATQYLGQLELVRGRYDEAERLLREAVVRRRTVGDDYGAIDAESMLAGAILMSGDPARVEEGAALLDRNVRELRTLLAGDHKDLVQRYQGLAVMHVRQGRFEEAAAAGMESYEMSRRLWGEGPSAAAANALGIVAVATLELGRTEEAEALFREAVEDLRVTEPQGQALASNLGNLASALRRRGEFAEAAALYDEAITVRELSADARHPRLDEDRTYAIWSHEAAGRFDLAEPHARRRLELRRATHGPDAFRTRTAELDLAHNLAGQERWEEARAVLDELEPHVEGAFSARPDWRAAFEVEAAWVACRGGADEPGLEAVRAAAQRLETHARSWELRERYAALGRGAAPPD